MKPVLIRCNDFFSLILTFLLDVLIVYDGTFQIRELAKFVFTNSEQQLIGLVLRQLWVQQVIV